MTAPTPTHPHYPERKEKGTYLSYQRLNTQQTPPSSSHFRSTCTPFSISSSPWFFQPPASPVLFATGDCLSTGCPPHSPSAALHTYMIQSQLLSPAFKVPSSGPHTPSYLHRLLPCSPSRLLPSLVCSVNCSLCCFLLDCPPGQSHPII